MFVAWFIAVYSTRNIQTFNIVISLVVLKGNEGQHLLLAHVMHVPDIVAGHDEGQ